MAAMILFLLYFAICTFVDAFNWTWALLESKWAVYT